MVFGSPVTRFVLETILLHIEESLFIACANGGKAFGSFVRDIIVPRMENPLCDVSFNSVSIWFRRKDQVRRFINRMRQTIPKLGLNCTFEEISPDISEAIIQRYALMGTIYNLSVHATSIAWFDIVISDDFPVSDFDVNCLTYSCREDLSTGKKLICKELKSEKEYSKEDLIDAINRKEATMFDSYTLEVINDCNYLDIINRLISKGWVINIRNVRCTEPITKNKISIVLNEDPLEDTSTPLVGCC